MSPACVSSCPSRALVSGPEDEVLAEGRRRIETYTKRLGREFILYGADTVNSVVGRLGWVSIASREDAEHYDLPAKPGKATMMARDLVKVGGVVGAAGVVAGAALHALYLFSKRKEQVSSAEHETKEVGDE